MASDGFQDQFGGPAGRKYLSKNFRNLLLSVSDKPMNIQKEILESALIQWKGAGEQMDDVTVLGLRV
jgi:serine phosphatase RsbU (regulator of sigma subunit)